MTLARKGYPVKWVSVCPVLYKYTPPPPQGLSISNPSEVTFSCMYCPQDGISDVNRVASAWVRNPNNVWDLYELDGFWPFVQRLQNAEASGSEPGSAPSSSRAV